VQYMTGCCTQSENARHCAKDKEASSDAGNWYNCTDMRSSEWLALSSGSRSAPSEIAAAAAAAAAVVAVFVWIAVLPEHCRRLHCWREWQI